VLVPKGSIDVGLETQQISRTGPVNSETLQIGIMTAAGGSIRAFVGDSIGVALSKLVTLFGGDILIYSQEGNIDAGRGSRDSISSLALDVDRVLGPTNAGALVDSGFRSFRPPLNASGSGIRTISFDPDGPGGQIVQPQPGAISLFASRGFVNAGEAGVSSAGNLIVVAQQVLNAANFSAVGTSTGVPLAAVAGISGALLGAAGSSASATRAAEEASKNLGSAGATALPSFISVEVVGYGEEGDAADPGGLKRKR